MAYDKAFNTPLVVFTAYNGDMVSDIPQFTWKTKAATELGLPAATTYKHVYSNGDSFIAYGSANSTGNYSCYDPLTKTWSAAFTTKATLHYYGNGVFLFVNGSSVYASFDGASLQYAGYLPGLGNPVMCGASDGKYGLLSAWWVNSPMYAKADVGVSGAWALTGTFDKDGMCCFTDMTCHRGMFVGIASDTIVDSGKGGIQISSNGYQGRRTMQYAYGHTKENHLGFGNIRSVGGHLFLKCSGYVKNSDGTTTGLYQLCVMNNNAGSYAVVREETEAEIPALSTMVYVEKLGQYLQFGDNVIYASPDGFSWKAVAQTNFSGTKNTAAYIPGDGFYVSSSGSWGENTMYYCAYP